jgi:hypothetical protein
MILQWLEALGLPPWGVAHLTVTHRKVILSTARLVPLIVVATLLYTADSHPVQLSCHSPSADDYDDPDLRNAITVGPKSQVSFQRTTGSLLVHIWKGNTLIRYPQSSAASVVVTAGNAQLSHIEAIVCVDVRKNRTIIEVLMGIATFTQLRAGISAHSIADLTLRTGDRLEVRSGTGEVEVRYALERPGDGGECSSPSFWRRRGR